MLNKKTLTLVSLLIFLTLFVGCFPPINQSPIITSTPITLAEVNELYTYEVEATDPDGNPLTYSLEVKPSGMTISSTTGLIMWTPIAEGNYAVVVKVSDGVLDISQSFTITVSGLPAVNQAPTIYSIPITTAIVGVTYFYDVNATDPDGDTLTYSLTAGPSGMNVSSASGLIMWTPTAKGNYAVTVKVSDGALSDTQGFTIVVSKPTVPVETYTITSSAGTGGIISPLGDVTVNSGSDRLFTITPDTNYNIADVLVDESSVGAVAFYTFTNVAKDHTIHATFTADEPEPEPVVNHKPSITSTPITTAILGVPYAYEVDATDPDGDTLTYSLTVKPDSMDINSTTGVISWTPTSAQIGNNPVTVEAFDGALNDTQSFTIKVSKPPVVNQAPNITSTAITTATVGVAYTYDVDATDPDGDTLTYSLITEPEGILIDGDNGVITWTPDAIGSFDVTVEVSDGELSDTQDFTIIVSKEVYAEGRPDLVGTIKTNGLSVIFDIRAVGQANDGDDINPSKYYHESQFNNEYFTISAAGKFLKYNMWNSNTTPYWGTSWGDATNPLPDGVSFSQTEDGDDFVYVVEMSYAILGISDKATFSVQIKARDFNDDFVSSYTGYEGFDGLYSFYTGLYITNTGTFEVTIP